MVAAYTNRVSTIWVALVQPSEAYSWEAYVPPGVGSWPMPGVHRVSFSPLLQTRGCIKLLKQLTLQSFCQPGVA